MVKMAKCIGICAATLALAACVPNGKNDMANTSPRTEEVATELAERATLEVGDAVEVGTDTGKANVSIESMTVDSDATLRARESDGLGSLQEYALLQIEFENVSIPQTNDSLTNWLDLAGSLLSVMNEDGVALASPGFSYEYPGYEVATGGYLQVPESGQKLKVAIPYVLDASTDEVEVKVANVTCAVTVRR